MAIIAHGSASRQSRPSLLGSLYVQVLIAILAGAILGILFPSAAVQLKPLGDIFVKLVKMVISPVIFLSVVAGVSGRRDLGGLGRVAIKALGYFMAVSTLALAVGLAVALIFHPGAGMNVDPSKLDAGAVAEYIAKARGETLTSFLTQIVPTTLSSAMVDGNVLQVLFVAVLFGVSLALVGKPVEPVRDLFERLAAAVFKLVAIIMKAAPIGAFGAMAFTVGKFGIGTLANLLSLVAAFYVTSFLFISIVLGAIARLNGFSLLGLLRYLKAELLLVLGTSSSEAALPSLIAKMEAAGCDGAVVGLVVPTGYSFNLDGTNIYMTLAALFIAQACNIHLGVGQIALLLGVSMLSSKGAAGVTGAGFIALAATLALVPTVPATGLALILGIDRFMSQCRSLTNFIGNAVATIVVARWEDKLDRAKLAATLSGRYGDDGIDQELTATAVSADRSLVA